jgi:plasmid maintenance system antidote protein VapI
MFFYNGINEKKHYELYEGKIYMSAFTLAELLNKAMNIAIEAHKGVTDKGGNPYILHPDAVASRVKTIKQKIVAWLHDVVEDTKTTFDDLRKEGFPEDIIQAIVAVTRRENESYAEFCIRASENEIAIDVKIADIKENLDFSRLVNPTEEDIRKFESRAVRYQKALKMLIQKKISDKQQEFKPDYAIPPAETLQEILEDREITLQDVKNTTGIPLHLLERIMKAEAKIDEFTSEKLGIYLHIPKDFLYRLEVNYQETLARLKKEESSHG